VGQYTYISSIVLFYFEEAITFTHAEMQSSPCIHILIPGSSKIYREPAKSSDTTGVVAGVDIVLSSLRSQALGLELFTNLGIDPAGYRVVVVKSSQHFRHEFGPIAAGIIYVDSPGTLTQDYFSIPYTKLTRPMWPLVEDPFSLTD